VQYRSGDAKTGEDEHRPNQNDAEIVAEPPAQSPETRHLPDFVESFLDFLQQAQHGVKQQGDAQGPQHTDSQIFDKIENLAARFQACLAQSSKPASPNGSRKRINRGSNWFCTPNPLSTEKVTANSGTSDSNVV